MAFNISDIVIMKNPTGNIVRAFLGEQGVVLKIAEKTPCPYQVKFSKNHSIRWCKEEELELVCD